MKVPYRPAVQARLVAFSEGTEAGIRGPGNSRKDGKVPPDSVAEGMLDVLYLEEIEWKGVLSEINNRGYIPARRI